MTKKELRTFDRYRYGKRAFLLPGSRFRASGGPYYVGTDDEGRRIRARRPRLQRHHQALEIAMQPPGNGQWQVLRPRRRHA